MFYHRKDAKLIRGLSLINRMFPYIMRDKIGSQVYVPLKLNMDGAVEYVKSVKGISYFDILIAALMRSIAEKPHLNRFIKGRHYYQRRDLSATIVVKKRLTESDDERQAIIRFQPDDCLKDTTRRLRRAIEDTRSVSEDDEEKIMKILLAFPTFIVNIITKLLFKMDDWGGMPQFLAESDGMHSSVYVANLGSIRFDEAPFHHLYEWGSVSIFMTFGRLHKELISGRDGTPKLRYIINAAVSIDERISEGIYYANALKLFRKYVENPVLMEEKPQLPEIWERLKDPGGVISP